MAPRRKKVPNKNANRNKEGFAFDKHRKKAPRKVVTYRCIRGTDTAYASFRGNLSKIHSFAVAHPVHEDDHDPPDRVASSLL